VIVIIPESPGDFSRVIPGTVYLSLSQAIFMTQIS